MAITSDWFNDPCIDLRDSNDFIAGHIKGTTSLSVTRLNESQHELPDRHCTLKLMGSKSQIEMATTFLLAKGYKISGHQVTNDKFWTWAKTQGLISIGCNSTPLWQANPLLVEHIPYIETLTEGRKALDLACGAGRDSTYLATRGWQVTAIDNKADALSRCQQLADNANTVVQTRQMDLESPPIDLAPNSADLILVMRYLHRPLLAQLKTTLKPNGVILYSTFMRGAEKFGSPKNPNYLLKAGELAEVYKDLVVHHDLKKSLPDGRPIGCFIAQNAA